MAQHGADDVAVRDEQDAPPVGFAERAHHRLDAARLDLADTSRRRASSSGSAPRDSGGSPRRRSGPRRSSLPSARIGLPRSAGPRESARAAEAGRDYLGRLARAHQRTGHDQVGLERAHERRPIAATCARPWLSSSTGLRPITRPSRFHGGLAMAHQERDAAHAAGLFQFFRHVKRPQRHTFPALALR